MIENLSRLNIVRIGSHITFSSLKEIGIKIVGSFRDIIEDFTLSHYNTPVLDSIDAHFLTLILHDEYEGHTLGITDADLRTSDEDEFYNSILGGKNPENDVAVVSTKKLSPAEITSENDYDLYVARTLKVSLHEVGHNLGLTDHASYQTAQDGLLCPMSRGEFNKFGYFGYVRAIVDSRGLNFCEECTDFLKEIYRYRGNWVNFLRDGLQFAP
jgi:predicted Zn-dependent protease